MKGQRKIPYESILLAAIVSVIWTLACAFKGIYPFGDYVLSVGDMREQSIPVYTFLWDVMHGQKSLSFPGEKICHRNIHVLFLFV